MRNSRRNVTFRFERWRAVGSGVLETAATTFLLLIAVRHFNAGPVAKAAVAGAGSLGLLISPAVVSFVAHRGYAANRAASHLLVLGAMALSIPLLVPGLAVYVIGAVTGMAASAALIPLLTHIYQENYPERERGRLFSRTIMIRIATAALFSKVAGDWLSGQIDAYRWLLVLFVGALLLSAFCLARCPTAPISPEGGGHPLRALRYVREDALFRRTLICWMLMGFGNLMMWPLRVEYLANPRYGLHLSVSEVALLVGVIPNIARLIMSPVWGWLFDHMNFFALRVTLNVAFAIGIAAFFLSQSFSGLVLGSIIFGVSNAGGDVAWSLWVTKFAPPGRVPDYMAVHTFTTGIRGVLAPLLSFFLVLHLSMPVLAWIACGLILAAAALLVPEISWGKGAHRVAPLVEEVND